MARGDGEKFVAIADKIGTVGEGNLLWYAVDGGGLAEGNLLVFIAHPSHVCPQRNQFPRLGIGAVWRVQNGAVALILAQQVGKIA